MACLASNSRGGVGHVTPHILLTAATRSSRTMAFALTPAPKSHGTTLCGGDEDDATNGVTVTFKVYPKLDVSPTMRSNRKRFIARSVDLVILCRMLRRIDSPVVQYRLGLTSKQMTLTTLVSVLFNTDEGWWYTRLLSS